MILIDARPESDLNWKGVESEIEIALEMNQKLQIEFDFGFSHPRLRDSAIFFSRDLAVTRFQESIYNSYKAEIEKIILYRGKPLKLADFDFPLWKEDFFVGLPQTDQMERLYSMELFMQYLHRLNAPLIDEIPLVVQFDLSEVGRSSYQKELLSQPFFSYITPDIDKQLDATLGIVLPEMGKVDYDLLDTALKELEGAAYRVLPESLIVENWHGLDHLLVFSKSLTDEGKRMLKGFEAAEGRVIGVEGFEPPTFWSQTRRASQTALYSERGDQFTPERLF